MPQVYPACGHERRAGDCLVRHPPGELLQPQPHNIPCVCQVRTNSSLKKQAEFINRLKDGDIWSHVIIIVKQSVNPKYDARGALAAMQVGDVTANKAQLTSIRIYYLLFF